MHPSCTHRMPYLPSWHSHATASHEPSFEKDIVSAPDLSPASRSVNVALREQTTITTYLLEMDKVACKACGTCACLPDLHLRRRCVDCRAGAGSSLPSRIANFICSYVCSPTCGTDSAQCRERCFRVASDVAEENKERANLLLQHMQRSSSYWSPLVRPRRRAHADSQSGWVRFSLSLLCQIKFPSDAILGVNLLIVACHLEIFQHPRRCRARHILVCGTVLVQLHRHVGVDIRLHRRSSVEAWSVPVSRRRLRKPTFGRPPVLLTSFRNPHAIWYHPPSGISFEKSCV